MKKRRLAIYAIAILGLAVLVYAWQIEPRRLEITRIQMPAPLAEAFGTDRVVFLADLHVTPGWPLRELLLSTLTALDPDYLFLGGDLVWYQGDIDAAVDVLKRLPAKKGAFAVLGDADYMGRIRNCNLCHVPNSRELRRDLPVTFLRNEATDIAGGNVRLLGLDGDRRGRWRLVCKETLLEGKPSLVLSHYPEALQTIAETGADLVLAGDTHGGQVIAPRWAISILFGDLRSRYLYGWFNEGRTAMFVTRGLGESILPLRLGRAPEIVVLEGQR